MSTLSNNDYNSNQPSQINIPPTAPPLPSIAKPPIAEPLKTKPKKGVGQLQREGEVNDVKTRKDKVHPLIHETLNQPLAQPSTDSITHSTTSAVREIRTTSLGDRATPFQHETKARDVSIFRMRMAIKDREFHLAHNPERISKRVTRIFELTEELENLRRYSQEYEEPQVKEANLINSIEGHREALKALEAQSAQLPEEIENLKLQLGVNLVVKAKQVIDHLKEFQEAHTEIQTKQAQIQSRLEALQNAAESPQGTPGISEEHAALLEEHNALLKQSEELQKDFTRLQNKISHYNFKQAAENYPDLKETETLLTEHLQATITMQQNLHIMIETINHVAKTFALMAHETKNPHEIALPKIDQENDPIHASNEKKITGKNKAGTHKEVIHTIKHVGKATTMQLPKDKHNLTAERKHIVSAPTESKTTSKPIPIGSSPPSATQSISQPQTSHTPPIAQKSRREDTGRQSILSPTPSQKTESPLPISKAGTTPLPTITEEIAVIQSKVEALTNQLTPEQRNNYPSDVVIPDDKMESPTFPIHLKTLLQERNILIKELRKLLSAQEVKVAQSAPPKQKELVSAPKKVVLTTQEKEFHSASPQKTESEKVIAQAQQNTATPTSKESLKAGVQTVTMGGIQHNPTVAPHGLADLNPPKPQPEAVSKSDTGTGGGGGKGGKGGGGGQSGNQQQQQNQKNNK